MVPPSTAELVAPHEARFVVTAYKPSRQAAAELARTSASK